MVFVIRWVEGLVHRSQQHIVTMQGRNTKHVIVRHMDTTDVRIAETILRFIPWQGFRRVVLTLLSQIVRQFRTAKAIEVNSSLQRHVLAQIGLGTLQGQFADSIAWSFNQVHLVVYDGSHHTAVTDIAHQVEALTIGGSDVL